MDAAGWVAVADVLKALRLSRSLLEQVVAENNKNRLELRPAARTHVHLADALDSAVGKRANVDVMLEVSPARLRAQSLRVFRSQNGVVLVRRVPIDSIVGLLTIAPRAKREEAALRALFFSYPRGS